MQTGESNVAIGSGSDANTTASLAGHYSLDANTTGNYNVTLGHLFISNRCRKKYSSRTKY